MKNGFRLLATRTSLAGSLRNDSYLKVRLERMSGMIEQEAGGRDDYRYSVDVFIW